MVPRLGLVTAKGKDNTLSAGEVATVTYAPPHYHGGQTNLKLRRESDQEDLGNRFNAADLATPTNGQLLLHFAAASGCSAEIGRAHV